MAVTPENVLPDEEGEVAKLRDRLKVNPPDGKWWWD
jgi:hypothetical protein